MKNRKLFITGAISLVILTAWLGCQKSTAEQPRQRVVAYLPTWRMPFTPDWEKITHLCLAFGRIQADGTVDVASILPHRDIIDEAHRHHVKVLLSLGGGGSHSFTHAILNDSCRSRLVQQLQFQVKELNLDGLDIDYEEWDGGEQGASPLDIQRRSALESLYRELRTTLGTDILLSAAVNASYDTGGFGLYNCFNNTMHHYLDFVSLMIYDATGPWSGTHTGPHSDWEFFEKAIHHWLVNRELPAEKLVAGVPFYGYKFSRRGYANDAVAMTYQEILRTYPHQNAHLSDSIGLLYYNGMPTIARKTRYVKEHQLGGIMIWELAQDSKDPETSLLQVIGRTLRE
ncbi:MAG: hypothetical protein IJ494_05475 [Bacteroides sp.]|nr:hypothetical protein [Bacteroides sp.]